MSTAAPTPIASFSPNVELVGQLGGAANAVAVAGRYAFVADRSFGLRVIDVSNPAAPVEAGFYDTPGQARSVALAGNYVYVADYDGGLFILRITDE